MAAASQFSQTETVAPSHLSHLSHVSHWNQQATVAPSHWNQQATVAPSHWNQQAEDSVVYFECAINSRHPDTPIDRIICYKYEYFRIKEICKTISYTFLNTIVYLWDSDIKDNKKARRFDLLEYDIKRVRNFLNTIGYHYNGMFDEEFPDNPTIFREAAILDYISANKRAFI